MNKQVFDTFKRRVGNSLNGKCMSCLENYHDKMLLYDYFIETGVTSELFNPISERLFPGEGKTITFRKDGTATADWCEGRLERFFDVVEKVFNEIQRISEWYGISVGKMTEIYASARRDAMKFLVIGNGGGFLINRLMVDKVELCDMADCRFYTEEAKEAILSDQWDVVLFSFENVREDWLEDNPIGGILAHALFAIKHGIRYVIVAVNGKKGTLDYYKSNNVLSSCNGVFPVNNSKLLITDKLDRVRLGNYNQIDWEIILKQMNGV